MNTKNTIKIVGYIIAFISLYKIAIYSLGILNLMFPALNIRFVVNKVTTVNLVVIYKYLIAILTLVAGIGIIRLKKWGVRILFLVILLGIIYDVLIGMYGNFYSTLISGKYNLKGNLLFILLFFIDTLFWPILAVTIFNLKKIKDNIA